MSHNDSVACSRFCVPANSNKVLLMSQDWILAVRSAVKSLNIWGTRVEMSLPLLFIMMTYSFQREHTVHYILSIILFRCVFVCVCVWYLPWKMLLSVRKCRRYCGSPFLFTTQELMVRGGWTQEDEQLDDLRRRREINCVESVCLNLKGDLIMIEYIQVNASCVLCYEPTHKSQDKQRKMWFKNRKLGYGRKLGSWRFCRVSIWSKIFINCGFSGNIH